jgi:hypothetical protein
MTAPKAARRLVVVGVAVVVVALAVGTGLWFEGATQRVDAAPALQSVNSPSDSITDLCPLLSPSPPCTLYLHGINDGAVYVGAAGLYVFAFSSYTANGSAVVELAGGSLHPTSETPVPCGFGPAPQYPNAGPYVFLSCQTNETTYALVYNWSSASIVGMIPVPTSDPYNISYAYDAANARAYLAVGSGVGSDRLLTVDLPTLHVVSNVTMPFEDRLPMVWTAGSSGRAVAAEYDGTTLYTFDPDTSSWSSGSNLGGPIIAGAVDPGTGRIFLGVGPANASAPFDILALDPNSLDVISSTPVAHSFSYGGPWVVPDIGHGDVYLLWFSAFVSGDLIAVNISTGNVAGTLPCSTANGFMPLDGITYDPSTDTLAIAGSLPEAGTQGLGTDPALELVNLSHGTVLQPSYSAFPEVGVALPWYTAVGGLVLGAALLVVAGILMRGRDG